MQELSYHARARYPILTVGLSMMAFIMVKTCRDAVFFDQGGLRQLPLAYVWIAVAAVPAALFHLKALDRWGARKTRTALFFIAAIVFLPFVPYADAEHRVLMTVMFIIVPTIFAAVLASVWLLAGDLLDGAESDTLQRIYSRIGAASMSGGIVGGLLAKGLSVYLSPRYLLVLGSCVLVITGLLVAKAHREHPIENDSERQLQPEAVAADTDNGHAARPSGLMRQRYVHVLMAISALASIAALYIDFQFYAAVTLSGNNNAQFFASFYIILNLAALLIQLLVAPRLQAKVGIGGALMLLPGALLGGLGLFAVWRIVQAQTMLRVVEGGLKSSIHRSMWEQVYLPIKRTFRDVAKVVVDGAVQRVAEGVGAAVLLIWLATTEASLQQLSFTWLSWMIVVSSILWLMLTRYLGALGCADLQPSEVLIRLPDG